MEMNDFEKIEIMKNREEMNLFKTGDLIFFGPDGSISSKLIQVFMSATITHVGMILKLDYDYENLKKGIIYLFELGTNVECKNIKGDIPIGSRIVEFNDIFENRKSKIYWKRLYLNIDFLNYPKFANFF